MTQFLRIGDKWINLDEIAFIRPSEVGLYVEIYFKGCSESHNLKAAEGKELMDRMELRFKPANWEVKEAKTSRPGGERI
jgi:hypothetical protein